MVRIKDIAEQANTSPSTVSRVLNNDATLSVTDETRDRILRVAKKLNYKTYQERRNEKKSIREKLSIKVGIIIGRPFEEEANDPYYVSIRHGIEDECKDQGISNIKLFQFPYLNANKDSLHVDGLIVVGKINDKDIKKLSPAIDNIIYIDYCPKEDLYDSVIADFGKATNQLLDHLLSHGYKHIGYIGGMHEKQNIQNKHVYKDQRHIVFEQRMKEEGIYRSDDVYIDKFTMPHGYQLMKQAISKGNLPEAFFVASDRMAIGAINALHEENIQVPEDVAIVSIDDIEIARFFNPPLTTVSVPTEEMGRTGVKLLLDRIHGRDIPLKVTVPTKLVIRKSCGSQLFGNK